MKKSNASKYADFCRRKNFWEYTAWPITKIMAVSIAATFILWVVIGLILLAIQSIPG